MLQPKYFIAIVIVCTLPACISSQTNRQPDHNITKVIMSLSAFGVESDDFPSIEVYIDFDKDSSNCVKSYYNPAYKGSAYRLSAAEMQKVRILLEESNLNKLKTSYKWPASDQPTSTTIIYSRQTTFTITDYGLKGDEPLPELYKLVYKF